MMTTRKRKANKGPRNTYVVKPSIHLGDAGWGLFLKGGSGRPMIWSRRKPTVVREARRLAAIFAPSVIEIQTPTGFAPAKTRKRRSLR